jgi:hypothetical protein
MRAMDVPRPRWTSSSFLLYAGGLTVLASAVAALEYLMGSYAKAAWAGWTALVFATLLAIAEAFRRRGHWITAGVFAFAAVAAWGFLVGALESWWGWLPTTEQASPFSDFHLGTMSVELLILAGAVAARRVYRFPLLVLPACVAAWLLVTDVLSNGGDWSAVVTFFVGVVFLISGSTVDRGPRRPYGFWLHVAAGLAMGGSLLYFWHSSDAEWALVSVAGLVYVGLAARLGRSSWAVLGALGLAAAASHFAIEWTRTPVPFFEGGINPVEARGWVPPLVFAFVGFLYVALGLLVAQRRPE